MLTSCSRAAPALVLSTIRACYHAIKGLMRASCVRVPNHLGRAYPFVAVQASVVDAAAMAQPHHQQHKAFVDEFANHPVVADAVAP